MYHLLVTAQEDAWDSNTGAYTFDLGRVFQYTHEPIKQLFVPMDGSRLVMLLSLPAIFAYESTVNKPARVGTLTSYQARGNEVRVKYSIDMSIAPIQSVVLDDLGWELEIDVYEMSRTHWAVKDVDLQEVLTEAALNVRGTAPVEVHVPKTTSKTVERALADAEALVKSGGATSAIDRVHTALHGFLLDVCERTGVHNKQESSLPALLKEIRNNHPAFMSDAVRRDEITKVLRSMGAIADSLSVLRNNASAAHPNSVLLEEPEAMLAVNAARTMLNYIDLRLLLHSKS